MRWLAGLDSVTGSEGNDWLTEIVCSLLGSDHAPTTWPDSPVPPYNFTAGETFYLHDWRIKSKFGMLLWSLFQSGRTILAGKATVSAKPFSQFHHSKNVGQLSSRARPGCFSYRIKSFVMSRAATQQSDQSGKYVTNLGRIKPKLLRFSLLSHFYSRFANKYLLYNAVLYYTIQTRLYFIVIL